MKNKRDQDNLPSFLLLSAFLHLIVMLILVFGLDLMPSKLPQEDVISFEILPVSSINNVKMRSAQTLPTIKNEDAKRVDKSSTESAVTENDPKKEDPKKEEVKPEVKPEPEPEVKPEPEPKPEPKPDAVPDPVKPEEKKPEPKPEDKKPEPKKPEDKKPDPKTDPKADPKPDPKKLENKKKATTDKQLDSLLKNLEKESKGHNDKSNKVNREKTEDTTDAFGKFDDSLGESMTSNEIIRQQITRKWNQPIASATEAIIITIRLSLEQDGTVSSADVLSVKCPSDKESLCAATTDSVRRAIFNASPLEHLEKSDYDSWRQIDIKFDTRR